MRTVPLSSRVRSVNRGKNGSAIASAAYQAGCAIDSELEGKLHDYRRKRGVEATEIVVPKGALRWAMDPGQLWNAAEMRETNKDPRAKSKLKANATTARTFFFGLAHELSPAGRLSVSRRAAQWVCDKSRVAVQFSIHEPGREGDHRNWHCHMIWTSRRVTPKGLGEKTREWDTKESASTLCRELRAYIAGAINEELAAEGKASAVFVEHRSFKAQGSGQKPTRHQGVTRTNIHRKEQRLAREHQERTLREQQRAAHAKELAGLKVKQDFNLNAKQDELAAREREGVKAIRAEMEKAQAGDLPPTGLRRVFLTATGQARTEAFNRHARAVDRVAAADRAIAALKLEIRAERNAFSQGQARERAALIERQAGEMTRFEREMARKLEVQKTMDRMAEIAARQPVQERSHERQGPSLTIH